MGKHNTPIVNVKALIRESAYEHQLGEMRASVKKDFLTGKSAFGMQNDYYTPLDETDKTLVFESRFESGNLSLAVKESDNEYNLVLQNDINTNGHTQCKRARAR